MNSWPFFWHLFDVLLLPFAVSAIGDIPLSGRGLKEDLVWDRERLAYKLMSCRVSSVFDKDW